MCSIARQRVPTLALSPTLDPALDSEAASLLCVGFQGPGVTPELRELIARGVRSVILFSRNVGEPGEVFELTRAIKALAPEPVIVGVDQEGGRVQRLRRGFTELAPLRALGKTRDPELAFAVGRLLGTELRAVGVDWNFAPVLDVDTNPNNPVIGQRAFGREPELVAELGVALAAGLADAGVAPCGKHFPGHGDTELDSHTALPRLGSDFARLRAVELVPFREAVAANVACMLTCHVLFTEIDAEYPATLSPRIVQAMLKDELGYQGAVITDDLDMKAIANRYTIEETVVRCLRAGCDGFLICNGDYDKKVRALEAVIREAEGDMGFAKRVEDAMTRMRRPKARFLGGRRPVLNPERLEALAPFEHQLVAEEMRQWL